MRKQIVTHKYGQIDTIVIMIHKFVFTRNIQNQKCCHFHFVGAKMGISPGDSTNLEMMIFTTKNDQSLWGNFFTHNNF